MEQRSEEWHLARYQRITASKFADVLGTPAKRKTYALQKLAELDGVPVEENHQTASMAWGVEQEDAARLHYWAETGNDVTQHPGQTHPNFPYVWGSPDGLIGDDGILEIKCPNSTRHIEYFITRVIPPEYIIQMQGLMWIFDRQWCDFMSFDPRNPTRSTLIIRVERDEDFISAMAIAIAQFWEAVSQGRLPDNGNGRKKS